MPEKDPGPKYRKAQEVQRREKRPGLRILEGPKKRGARKPLMFHTRREKGKVDNNWIYIYVYIYLYIYIHT